MKSDIMGKKTQLKKMRLGRKLKQARRLPLLVRLRTHGRVQQNRYSRNWRRSKLRITDE